MAEKYFANFRKINYAGQNCIDLTRRAAVTSTALQDDTLFYPYQVKEGERADALANHYYNDAYLSWLPYITNEIVDPYYEWRLTYEDLVDVAIMRYGSFAAASEKIVFWRNAWYADEEGINVARHSSLSVGELKYWSPVYGQGNRIMSYKRNRDDWVLNTNAYFRYVVADSSSFSVGDRVVIIPSAGINGSGEVCRVADGIVDVMHVQGTYDLGGTINGINIISSSLLADVIPADERAYWEPVVAWDAMQEDNASNAQIMVLDAAYALSTSLELKNLVG